MQIAQDELRAIMGLQAKPVFSHVRRWPDSMAQYTVGHKQRVDQIATLMRPLPGIAIGGNGYNGIGVPDCIHSGKQAAEAIAKSLTARGGGDRTYLLRRHADRVLSTHCDMLRPHAAHP